jgi:hypothetical protein
VKSKNLDSPPTAASGRVSAEVPGVTVIEPLPLTYEAKAKRGPRNLRKGVLVTVILAGVVSGSGLLLKDLSKRPRPELISTTASVPKEPEASERAQAAEGEIPPVPEKEKMQERSRAVSIQNQGAAGSKAEGALHPDVKSDDARKDRDRSNRKSLEELFHRHLSNGLTAYHEKNFAHAKSELTKAQELKPNTQVVTEALAQVEAAIRLQSIGDLKARAAEAEVLEEWGKALDLYGAALKIEATLQFAAQGRERTLERMEIDKRLQFYLQKPEALESDEYLPRASELLKRTEGIEPKGPRLNSQVEAFTQLIKEAESQTRVTLLSDGLTEVSVYRVGRLGRFSAHELLLRPGRYTIVGTRDGYKDVRQEISVKPGGASLQVNIVCREKV